MGPHAASRPLSLSERRTSSKSRMMNELEHKIVAKSVLFNLADGNLLHRRSRAAGARTPASTC